MWITVFENIINRTNLNCKKKIYTTYENINELIKNITLWTYLSINWPHTILYLIKPLFLKINHVKKYNHNE